MTQVKRFTMPFETSTFAKGQTVYVVMMTGSLACKACGKHKITGRYVTSWVRYAKYVEMMDFEAVKVEASFADKYNIGEI